MKKYIRTILLLSFTILVLSCNNKTSDNKKIQVSINKNIETLFVLYPLVDIGMPPVSHSLCEKARLQFKDFQNHKVVKLLDTLISRTGIDEPVNLLMYYSELPNIKQIHPLDTNMLKSFSDNKNVQNGKNLVDDFILQLSDFYTKAKVNLFFEDYIDYYNKALYDVQKHLPPENFVSTMEKYYGQKNCGYILNPSPVLYPGFGFGSRIETEKGLLIFNTFGAINDIENGVILFDFDNYAEIKDLSVHEFGHSFINPITELSENVKKINQYSYLFSPIEREMSEQAYRNWWICATEHLVRLGEIRIALAMNDSLTAKKIRTENVVQNKFIYLPFLEEKIIKYENNRDKYPSFSDFFPELIEAFSQIDTSEIRI